MDWSQATPFELFVFKGGLLFTLLIAVVLICAIAYIAWRLASSVSSRISKRMKTTKALRCEWCEYRAAARCTRFDIDIVERPWPNGCTWGVKKSKICGRKVER